MVNPVIDERAKKSYCQTNKKKNAFFLESHELNTLNNKEITMLESSKEKKSQTKVQQLKKNGSKESSFSLAL